MSFINKIFKTKKTKLIFVLGKDKERLSEFIFGLNQHFCKIKEFEKIKLKTGKLFLIFNDIVLLKDNSFSLGKIEEFFDIFDEVIVVLNSENLKIEKDVVSLLEKEDRLIVNDEVKDKLSGKRLKSYLSFGLSKKADFSVSDIMKSEKTNFKINYDGSSVPVWTKKEATKNDLLLLTAATSVGVLLGTNFVNLTKKIKK